MLLFAHHMAVELFGREFSPHGVFQHVCAFGAIALVLATSAYGTWNLGRELMRSLANRRREAGEPHRFT
ncbi:MAG: hypothetical protein P4L84_35140 [Isosphaeraceae bacterium]|nr:hypothetical protein [Isosphaeraceae bacterium]